MWCVSAICWSASLQEYHNLEAVERADVADAAVTRFSIRFRRQCHNEEPLAR